MFKIRKILSSNDVGLTGGHQSGMLVPKQGDILSYFPKLDIHIKNPRFLITFFDQANDSWEFSFIYYNNKFFGGTRNEFRLTRMTKFFKAYNLKVGDAIEFSLDVDGCRRLEFHKANVHQGTKLKLSTEWMIIPI